MTDSNKKTLKRALKDLENIQFGLFAIHADNETNTPEAHHLINAIYSINQMKKSINKALECKK